MQRKRKSREAVKEQPKKQARRSSTRSHPRAVLQRFSSEESDHSDSFDSLREVVTRSNKRELKALNTSFAVTASEDQVIPVIEGDRT